MNICGNADCRLTHTKKTIHIWRGACGHHWLREELEDCPICALAEARAEVGRLNKNDLLAQDAIHELDAKLEAAEAALAAKRDSEASDG